MAMRKSSKKLTKADVLHVAKLSNLTLSEDEIKKFTPQLSKIVDFISELSEVDTKDVEPVDQPLGLSNVLRDDEINTVNGLTQDNALSGTDSVKNGLFRVSKILEYKSDE